jgi:cob(I)alamin adenosyltransferase
VVACGALGRPTPLPIAAEIDAVRAEIKRAELSCAELAQRLREHGLEETEASIANNLSRGTFAATFFLATMKAIGRQTVNLEEV